MYSKDAAIPEGSVDLVKLANLGEDAVLCELTNEDGSMARLPEIVDFAIQREMTVVTIEDIYTYRKRSDQPELILALFTT